MIVNKDYWIDVLLAISFILVGFSGIVKFWIMPFSSSLQSFMGLTKHQWALMHDWSGVAMVALVFIHLVLHYEWIISETKLLLKIK